MPRVLAGRSEFSLPEHLRRIEGRRLPQRKRLAKGPPGEVLFGGHWRSSPPECGIMRTGGLGASRREYALLRGKSPNSAPLTLHPGKVPRPGTFSAGKDVGGFFCGRKMNDGDPRRFPGGVQALRPTGMRFVTSSCGSSHPGNLVAQCRLDGTREKHFQEERFGGRVLSSNHAALFHPVKGAPPTR